MIQLYEKIDETMNPVEAKTVDPKEDKKFKSGFDPSNSPF